MSQYRAYPAYKDYGIEWIGQVPEHWQLSRVVKNPWIPTTCII